MIRKLEIIEIGNIPLLSREGTTWNEASEILEFQHAITNAVRWVKGFDGNKKSEASKRINNIVDCFEKYFGQYNISKNEVENTAREYARRIW